jgi:hypothetical protein
MEKGRKASKYQDIRKFNPKDEVTKPNVHVWDSGWSGFPRTNRV